MFHFAESASLRSLRARLVAGCAAILLSAASVHGSPMRIATLAGGPGRPPHNDGDTSTATFSYPTGVAADGLGNVYIADSGNHVIRLLTPSGEVRTLAGQPGIPGGNDGQGAAARFRNPTGIAVDIGGDVLVADSGNCTIRRIGPAGNVTTVAGTSGQCGFNDASSNAARFAHPTGLVVDVNGDIYVADRSNHVIRRIQDGFVSTHVGTPLEVGSNDGRGLDARFYLPFGLAIDALGDLYIADSGNHLIRRVTRDRVVSTVCGTREKPGAIDGECGDAMLNRPSGIAVTPEGSLLIADTDNHTIRRMSTDGRLETAAGLARVSGFSDGIHNTARMLYPFGVALAPDGSLLIVELLNHALRQGNDVAGSIRRRPASRR